MMWTFSITPKGKKALKTLEVLTDKAGQTLELTKDDDITQDEVQHILGVDYVHARDILIILEQKGYIKHTE